MRKVCVGSVYARGLLTGRKKKPFIRGVHQFNTKYIVMLNASRRGCPFAIMILRRIHSEISICRKEVIRETKRIDKLPPLFDMEFSYNKKYTYKPIKVVNTHVRRFVGAILLFDELVFCCIKARKCGALSGYDSGYIVNEHKTRLRKLLEYCCRYEDYGFVSDDNKINSKEWLYMVSLFGAVDSEKIDNVDVV